MPGLFQESRIRKQRDEPDAGPHHADGHRHAQHQILLKDLYVHYQPLM